MIPIPPGTVRAPRPPAPLLTDAERAVQARFDAANYPAEVAAELLAVARRAAAQEQALRELAEEWDRAGDVNDESARASLLGSTHAARHTGLRDAYEDAAARLRAVLDTHQEGQA